MGIRRAVFPSSGMPGRRAVRKEQRPVLALSLRHCSGLPVPGQPRSESQTRLSCTSVSARCTLLVRLWNLTRCCDGGEKKKKKNRPVFRFFRTRGFGNLTAAPERPQGSRPQSSQKRIVQRTTDRAVLLGVDDTRRMRVSSDSPLPDRVPRFHGRQSAARATSSPRK